MDVKPMQALGEPRDFPRHVGFTVFQASERAGRGLVGGKERRGRGGVHHPADFFSHKDGDGFGHDVEDL